VLSHEQVRLEVESLKYKLIVVTRELKSIFGISLDKLEAASFRENLHTTIQGEICHFDTAIVVVSLF
jgi:acid stress-induced BolA-like protein IbaG/YrbA